MSEHLEAFCFVLFVSFVINEFQPPVVYIILFFFFRQRKRK